MKESKPRLSQIFETFLADQKERVSARTFSKYLSIIELYKAYLEDYWPNHGDEYAAITRKKGTYCGTFGAEDATTGYDEFLRYFMPRKVMCGKETLKAAGTVTKALAKSLSEHGYTMAEELEAE